MKKYILFLLLFSSTLIAGYATPGTGISWNLDSLVVFSEGSVTYGSGYYTFHDTLIITQYDTLKILSNATIKIAPVGVFTILGTLIINPPDSVKITSVDTTQKFHEMRLEDFSDASILKKMIFEYSFNGIKLLNTNILIDSCVIRFNCSGNSSIVVPAINLFNSNAVISHCRIYRNYKVAIGSGANIASAPQIINNIIYENNIANGNVPQINLGQSGTGTTLIKGNTIRGLYTNAGGIATLPIGNLNIIIENNIIKNNRYGIAIQNANTTALIRENIIDSNNIQGIAALGGSGINFNGSSSLTAIVTRNFIRWNLWGVTIQSSAKPDLGNLNNADTSDNGFNYIYGNFHNDTIPDLYNNTPDSIMAENNFWGTGNLSIIEQHIFHKPDNPALGFVDYIPIYIPVPIENNRSTEPLGFKLYDIYPNPFNPVAVIKYEIPFSEFVTVKIYDIEGRIVKTIFDGHQTAGLHEIAFNAEDFSSGIYFCRFESGNYNVTKKLILLK